MERMVLYPGCPVLSRFDEYELASRRILDRLALRPWESGRLPAIRFLGRQKLELLMANEGRES